jgi:hypothetical protein
LLLADHRIGTMNNTAWQDARGPPRLRELGDFASNPANAAAA